MAATYADPSVTYADPYFTYSGVDLTPEDDQSLTGTDGLTFSDAVASHRVRQTRTNALATLSEAVVGLALVSSDVFAHAEAMTGLTVGFPARSESMSFSEAVTSSRATLAGADAITWADALQSLAARLAGSEGLLLTDLVYECIQDFIRALGVTEPMVMSDAADAPSAALSGALTVSVAALAVQTAVYAATDAMALSEALTGLSARLVASEPVTVAEAVALAASLGATDRAAMAEAASLVLTALALSVAEPLRLTEVAAVPRVNIAVTESLYLAIAGQYRAAAAKHRHRRERLVMGAEAQVWRTNTRLVVNDEKDDW